jgi:hypothetical protein
LLSHTHQLITGSSFPETEGKTLDEMDAVLGDQVIDHALEAGHTHNVPGLDGNEKNGSLEKIETKLASAPQYLLLASPLIWGWGRGDIAMYFLLLAWE